MSMSRNDSTQAMRSLIGAYDESESESETDDDTTTTSTSTSTAARSTAESDERTMVQSDTGDSRDDTEPKLNILGQYSERSGYSENDSNEDDDDHEIEDFRKSRFGNVEDIVIEKPAPSKRQRISKLVSYDESLLESPTNHSKEFMLKNQIIDEDYNSDHSMHSIDPMEVDEVQAAEQQQQEDTHRSEGHYIDDEDDLLANRTAAPRTTSMSSVEDVPEQEEDDGEDGIPPEPVDQCSQALQDKIISFHLKMERDGIDLNSVIQERKDFRNPSIYEKLVQFCNIDEKGTNYPEHLYNPHIYGPESYYEELSKVQKLEMEKLEKEKKEKNKVEFVPGMKKGHSSESDLKRKSKWDEPREDKRKVTINR